MLLVPFQSRLNDDFCNKNFECPSSAVSRPILKPVYRFGIQNSDPQTLQSMDFWCKLSSPFVIAEPRERCFELFRMQNSKNFPGLCPWTPLGKAYSASQTSQLRNGFSPRYARRKTGTPQNCRMRL